MIDALESDVFHWFEDLIEVFEKAVKDLDRLFQEKPPEWQKDMQWTRSMVYLYSPDALFVGRHYFQALKMRTVAIQQGDFSWYCAATYALTHDWPKIVASIPWLAWGGSEAIGDLPAQALLVFVAAMLPTEQQVMEALQALNSEQDWKQAADQYISRRLIEVRNGRYYPGRSAPKPMPD